MFRITQGKIEWKFQESLWWIYGSIFHHQAIRFWSCFGHPDSPCPVWENYWVPGGSSMFSSITQRSTLFVSHHLGVLPIQLHTILSLVDPLCPADHHQVWSAAPWPSRFAPLRRPGQLPGPWKNSARGQNVINWYKLAVGQSPEPQTRGGWPSR